jgi:hypothetical protein
MRLIATSLIVLAAAAPLSLAVAAPAGAGVAPQLKIERMQPLEIHGLHFKSGESVTVLVLGGAGHASRRVTAGADGAWTVTFPLLKAKGRQFSVRAQGNDGSAAIWAPRTVRPTAGPTVTRPTNNP